MRNLKMILVAALLLAFQCLSAQNKERTTQSKTVLVTLTDGIEVQGEVINDDDKEILLFTENVGRVSIPKYKIRSIESLATDRKGKIIPKEHDPTFATRYFLTTNGMSIPKGEVQAMFALAGFDINYGVTDKISVGLMTSYFAIPIIGNVKYSEQLKENVHISAGVLLGTGSWASFNSRGALPYGAITFGDKKSNINFSAGYGAASIQPLFDSSKNTFNAGMFSVGGILAVTEMVSLVFDSFMFMPKKSQDRRLAGFVTPGFRIASKKSDSAFQFGFMGVVSNGEIIQIPAPSLRYFKKF